MKKLFSFSGSVIISCVASILLMILFPVDFMMGAMGMAVGLFAIGKISLAYFFLSERVVTRSSDVFRIPLWFFIYMLFIACIAGGLVYLSFFEFNASEWHPQTINNLKFFSSAISVSILIAMFRWIEIRKDLRIHWETKRSSILGKDIYLPQN